MWAYVQTVVPTTPSPKRGKKDSNLLPLVFTCTNEQIDGRRNRQTDGPTDIQMDGEPDRQRNGESDRQTDRWSKGYRD